MTNPNNAVGTNGAFGGRTSVNAFNDIMGAFQSRGVLSGWGISPSSGMTVSVGGNGTTRDVAVAEDANGNKTSVNNISGAPILVTLDSAPASNSRYDAIVAYVDKPPVGNATQDNPECCGIIHVTGTSASIPSYPSDATIRSAITADGASGATAYYAILGYVLVASGTTSITSGMITGAGNPMINGIVGTNQIQNKAVTSDKIGWATVERRVYQRERIGTFIANDNSKHELYRIYYIFGPENIPANGFTTHNLGLSDCYIVSIDFTIYRADVAGVINSSNDAEAFSVVFTDNGNWIRFINKLNVAQNGATIIGVIECYKRTS